MPRVTLSAEFCISVSCAHCGARLEADLDASSDDEAECSVYPCDCQQEQALEDQRERIKELEDALKEFTDGHSD